MRRFRRKQILLALLIGLLTLLWVGTATGFPGLMGQWPGFHAAEKGFPGWSANDQHVKPVDATDMLRETTLDEGQPPYAPFDYGGFGGTHNGNFPGGRPKGQ